MFQPDVSRAYVTISEQFGSVQPWRPAMAEDEF